MCNFEIIEMHAQKPSEKKKNARRFQFIQEIFGKI